MVKTILYKGHPKVLIIIYILKALNIKAMDRISKIKIAVNSIKARKANFVSSFSTSMIS